MHAFGAQLALKVLSRVGRSMKVLYSTDLLSLDMKTASYIDISEYLCSKRTMDFSTKYQLKIRDLNAMTKLLPSVDETLWQGLSCSLMEPFLLCPQIPLKKNGSWK